MGGGKTLPKNYDFGGYTYWTINLNPPTCLWNAVFPVNRWLKLRRWCFNPTLILMLPLVIDKLSHWLWKVSGFPAGNHISAAVIDIKDCLVLPPPDYWSCCCSGGGRYRQGSCYTLHLAASQHHNIEDNRVTWWGDSHVTTGSLGVTVMGQQGHKVWLSRNSTHPPCWPP